MGINLLCAVRLSGGKVAGTIVARGELDVDVQESSGYGDEFGEDDQREVTEFTHGWTEKVIDEQGNRNYDERDSEDVTVSLHGGFFHWRDV
jgi:hypothetical protein